MSRTQTWLKEAPLPLGDAVQAHSHPTQLRAGNLGPWSSPLQWNSITLEAQQMGIVINDILVTDMSHKTWKIKYLSETHMERQIQMQARQEPAVSLREGGWCWACNLSIGGLGRSEVGDAAWGMGLRIRQSWVPVGVKTFPILWNLVPWVLFWSLAVFPVEGDCWHVASGTSFGTVLAHSSRPTPTTVRPPQGTPLKCVCCLFLVMLGYSTALNNSLGLGFPDMVQVYPADSSRKPKCILMLFTQGLYVTLTDLNPTSTGLL